MKDKLAEKILKEKGFFVMTHKEGSEHVRKAFIEPVIKAMQAYHEAANKQITDLDIEAFADTQAIAYSKKDFERGLWLGIKTGAKAAFNGEIKHIEP